MKLAISKFGYKDRYTAEQVGFCLDDIIDAIENGKNEVKKPGITKDLNFGQREKVLQEKKDNVKLE